jgi:type 1 fimbria pilin
MKQSKLIVVLFFLGSSYAATTVNIKITVNAPPPCVVNKNNPVTVEFGNTMITSKVNGVNYRQEIPFTLECTRNTEKTLRLIINGNPSGFNTEVLKTSKDNLGIALLKDGVAMPLGSWLDIDYDKLPLLEAVPTAPNTALITAGEFVASATINVEYQ